MNVNALMDNMQGMDYEALLQSLPGMEEQMKNALMIASIVSIVIGLLWCFLGLKLVRVWAALLGLVLGFGIGAGAGAAFHLDSMMILICGAVAGLLLAVLGAVFYHVGVFILAWITGSSLAMMLLRPQDWKISLACLGVGLVIALLTIRFAELIMIVITGIYGAAGAGSGIISFLPVDNQIIRIAITVVLAAAGIAVQLLMESGKQKKKNLEKARKIREQNSTANEVEKARAVLNQQPADAKKGAVKKGAVKKGAAKKSTVKKGAAGKQEKKKTASKNKK